MLDDFSDFDIINLINTEEEKPEVINYDDSEDNVIEETQQAQKNNTATPNTIERLRIRNTVQSNEQFTKEDLKTLSTTDLKTAYSQLFDESGNVKERTEINSNEIDNFRSESVYNEALIYGLNSGLYFRMNQMKTFFESDDVQTELDKQFIFRNLLIGDGRVQPPIIVETKNISMIEDDRTYREIRESYTIREQAKFVQAPKNWRQYLLPVLNTEKPSPPSAVMLPKPNTQEMKEWEQGIEDGWYEGIEMANNSIRKEIQKMTNDFLGMVRYHIMIQQNMISNPIVYETPVGISRNENGDSMNIGERIIEIKEVSIFNANGDNWKALPQIDNLITGNP